MVVEGVETKEEAELLRNYGLCFFQGYYYSKTIPEEEFVKLLDQQ